MSDSLQRIANIAVMEQKLPKKSDEGTLWEREELTVRFLLEEGKLNMGLRILNDFKSATKSVALRRSLVQKASEAQNVPADDLDRKMDAFEQNLGLLISCALRSVESLQTLDIPLLIKHCGEVLSQSADDPEGMAGKTGQALEKCQETLCISYLLYIARRFEVLANEDRIMQLVDDYSVIPALISFLHRYYALYKTHTEPLSNAIQFLALAFDTEAFQTHKDKYIPNPDLMRKACEIRGFFIEDLLVDLNTRKKLLPLLDNLSQFKRKLGLS
eukprot:CAMPEP_0184656382 /NCGR_PEP_ID=MMETSP0308-20130426/16467_1 /TAXON_ID=38269 /ORGANISM="Gloeochaete witrockiana, Strain SAG 46.84" /LENGTH=271 /DNA_ID=CAMNT_0027093493 /DNA_START=184 /DNA_END=999 /DNA_ORIENTATION=+